MKYILNNNKNKFEKGEIFNPKTKPIDYSIKNNKTIGELDNTKESIEKNNIVGNQKKLYEKENSSFNEIVNLKNNKNAIIVASISIEQNTEIK